MLKRLKIEHYKSKFKMNYYILFVSLIHFNSAALFVVFQLLLTILTGVPGSSKESLCLALVALAKENSKYVKCL